jgi:hypothetical protein
MCGYDKMREEIGIAAMVECITVFGGTMECLDSRNECTTFPQEPT